MKKLMVLLFLFSTLAFSPAGAAATGLSAKKEMIAQAGKNGNKAKVPDLISILKSDPDGFTRGYAAWALGEIGDSRATGALQEALKDVDKGVRTEAGKAIAKLR